MPEYDVHSYRQIRVKARGIVADSPEDAIASLEGDEAFDAEVRRLVNVEGAGGPVVDVEYQDGGVPVGWLVDPLDAAGEVVGDGISFDVTTDGDPILATDRDRMPSPIQKQVVTTLGIDDSRICDFADSRNVGLRLDAIDPLAAALHRMLEGVDADMADVLLDGALCRIQALRANIANEANGPDARIPPGVMAALTPHGLTATFAEAEDETVDDEVEIRKPGVDEPIGGIQFCGRDGFMAGTWTSPAMNARRHGSFQRTAALATSDAIEMLKGDGWL
jgi:hypothetical protein